VSSQSWHWISKDGLRFYHLNPTQDIEILFTTRRFRDEGLNHNLDLKDQLLSLGWNDSLVTMKQTHSDRVVRVSEPGEAPADACFTLKKGLALSVRVADCVPIFVWGINTPLVGVIHAGRRGTLLKIALRFVEKVENDIDVPPHRLRYSLGPSIGKCCYKVGEEVLNEFREAWPEANRFFSRKKEGFYLDLRAANRFLLSSVGAVEGASLDICTRCNSKRFYSHRREHGAGRNWGIIVRR
jgi:YfiH family protein